MLESVPDIFPTWQCQKKIYKKLPNKKLDREFLPHPPYLPGLALSDYHIFLLLSNDLRYRKLENKDEIKRYLQKFFDSKTYTKGSHNLL